MITIGITGGIGSGKSTVTSYLDRNYRCRVVIADDLARSMQEPGGACYMQLMMLLGKDMLLPDGRFDRSKMAQKVFSDPKLLESVNKIVHPAVKRYVNEDIKRLLESENSPDFYVFEAALLLEEGYDEILDDMWYIYTDENERIRRLSESRSMSAVRARSIMASQLPDEVFRERCDIVIDNSKGFYYTENQINFRIEVLRSDKT